MFGSAYRIGTVYGIPIRLHWTLLLIVPVLPWSLGIFRALVLATGLLFSIALHELGHSLVAIRKGCAVRDIVLLPIGGVARMENIPSRPRDELLMAVAGPAVSFALAILFFLLGAVLPLRPIIVIPSADGGAWPVTVLHLLAAVNLGLAAFNLLPSFPMDGGRVLRAALTPRCGKLRATYIAMRIGRVIAVGLAVFGLFAHSLRLVLIAVAVYVLAGVEYRAVRRRESAPRFGFDLFGGGPPGGRDPDDRVEIGPPPYEDGSDRRSETSRVRREDGFW